MIPICRSNRPTPATTGPRSWPSASTRGRTGPPGSPRPQWPMRFNVGLADAASIRARGWDHVTYGALSTSLAASKLLGLDHGADRPRPGDRWDDLGSTPADAERASFRCGKGVPLPMPPATECFAALLAREGMTGPSPLFEGDMGFWQQVSGPFTLAQLGGREGE